MKFIILTLIFCLVGGGCGSGIFDSWVSEEDLAKCESCGISWVKSKGIQKYDAGWNCDKCWEYEEEKKK